MARPKKPFKHTKTLAIYEVPTDSVLERHNNSRVHSKVQIRQIADSIVEFGFSVPLLTDENNVLLAGHGRLAAARLLELPTVPVVRVEGLSEAQQRAFVIADNRLTDLSHFDKKKLRSEFEFLLGQEIDFTVEATGFDIVEIDQMLGMDEAADGGGEVALPAHAYQPVTREGDIWCIGEHRILCGSSLNRENIVRLFAGEKAAMVITDPPYNVPIAGNVSGLGTVKHRDFAMASGEMSRAEFTYHFLRPSFELIRDFSVAGTIAYIFMDWRHARDVEVAAEGAFLEHKNTCVWVKSNAGMSAFYRSQHEFVLVFKVSAGKHRNNFGLGGKGRHRSNVWQYRGVNVFRKGREKELESHPTVKNLQMVSDAILDCSAPGDIIFDGFLGSGTSAIAAGVTGRIGYGCELDPIYCDVIVRRFAEELNLEARLESGESFAEVAEARGVQIEEAN